MSVLPGGLLAIVLTLWNYDAKPMWRDEYFTYGTTNRSWSGMMNILEGPDVGLVGYYNVIHAWMVFGDSTAWMRAPGAIATILLVVVVGAIGHRVGGTGAGVAGGLIAAVLPAVTQHAQEARAYPLVLLAAALTGLLALRVASAPTRSSRLALAACALVTGLLHPLPGLPATAGILLGLLAFPGEERRRNVVAVAVPVAVIGTGLVVLAYIKQGDVDSGPANTLSGLLAFTANVAPSRLLTAVFAVPAFIGLASLVLDRHLPAAAVLLGWCVVPVAVIAALGVSGSYFQYRYIASIVPAVAVLMGLGVVAVGQLAARVSHVRLVGPALTAVAVVAVVGSVMPSLAADRRASFFFDDPVTVTAWLEQSYREGDAVVFSGGIGRGMVDHYSSGTVDLDDVLLLETPLRSDTLAGIVRPPEEWSSVLSERPRVWLVGTLTRDAWLNEDLADAVQSGRVLSDEFASGSFAAELWVMQDPVAASSAQP